MNIRLRDIVQGLRKFYSYDGSERILSSYEQHSAFSRTEIDERKSPQINPQLTDYSVDQRYRRPLVSICVFRPWGQGFQMANEYRCLGIEPIFEIKLLMSLNAPSDEPLAIWPNKVLSHQSNGAPQPIVFNVVDKSLSVIFWGDNRLGQVEVLCAVAVRAVASHR